VYAYPCPLYIFVRPSHYPLRFKLSDSTATAASCPCRIQCIFFLLLNQWRYSFSRSSDFQRAYGRFRLGPNSFDPGLSLAAHWLRLHVYVMPVDSQKIRMPVDKFDDPCDCLSTQYFLCDDEAQIPKKPSANVYVKISRSLQIAKVTGPQIHGGLGDGSLF
jgi:hypothetical protein